MGHFKNETGERNLVIVLANQAEGGLEVRKWVDRFTALLLLEGREKEVGPALCGMDGFMLKQSTLNAEVHAAINKLHERLPTLIPREIAEGGRVNLYRSFRRGVTTRPKEQGVEESTIEMNNRWRKVENKQGGLPNLPMTQLYVEITQALTSKLRFSLSL